MLAVPRLLDELVVAGRWPRDSKEAMAQNLKSLAPPERIQALAPEEQWLYLLPPPFYTVRQKSEGNPFWMSDMAAPHGIDFDLTLDIADFGLGSDAPILLDYREDAANPRVIRLRWSGNGKANEWVVMAPDFSNFVKALGALRHAGTGVTADGGATAFAGSRPPSDSWPAAGRPRMMPSCRRL